jgi:hypothetical protein
MLTVVRTHWTVPTASANQTGQKCFVELPSGSTVVSQTVDRTVALWPDGSKHTYSLAAGNCTATEGRTFTINGYVTYAQTTLSPQFYSLQAQWSVPPAPTVQDGSATGNLIGLWDGIQVVSTGTVSQPLLIWGCQNSYYGSCILGGAYWWISAEYCANTCTYSSPITVSVGDTIVGQLTWVTAMSCGGPVVYTGYTITITDQTISRSTTLNACTDPGTVGNPAVLEAQRVTACNQLPATTSLSFNSISSNPSTGWTGYNQPGLSPDCTSSYPNISGNSVTLYWKDS